MTAFVLFGFSLRSLWSKCIKTNESCFFPPLSSHHKSIQVHLKISATFWLVYKKQTHQYLNESFACRQPDCLHSLSPCIKAPHSIPTELCSAHVQLFISLCQEFSLASTCQYPPQIGRQAHIWHMVQSRAAFPSLFSWPASTPEEHSNTHWYAQAHEYTHTDTHSHKYMYTHQWCTMSVSFVSEIPPLRCWAFVHNLFATGFKVFNNSIVHAVTAKSATARYSQF